MLIFKANIIYAYYYQNIAMLFCTCFLYQRTLSSIDDARKCIIYVPVCMIRLTGSSMFEMI